MDLNNDIIATTQSAADVKTNRAPVSIGIRQERKIINIPINPANMAPHQ